MKYKKRLAHRDARIKDWENNLSKKGVILNQALKRNSNYFGKVRSSSWPRTQDFHS